MFWYHWMALSALAICIGSCLFHLIRLVRLGNPLDYSKQRGNIRKAVGYSFTKAMSPAKKESAYLHLPTYTAGIVYHLGTFLSIFLFITFLFSIHFYPPISLIFAVFLITSGISGLGILVKRMVKPELRSLSNPDDFISNLLVTIFQLSSAYVLLSDEGIVFYAVITSILLLYLPLGKLKHTIYFFAARYHLGLFYGWRGIWPIVNHKN